MHARCDGMRRRAWLIADKHERRKARALLRANAPAHYKLRAGSRTCCGCGSFLAWWASKASNRPSCLPSRLRDEHTPNASAAHSTGPQLCTVQQRVVSAWNASLSRQRPNLAAWAQTASSSTHLASTPAVRSKSWCRPCAAMQDRTQSTISRLTLACARLPCAPPAKACRVRAGSKAAPPTEHATNRARTAVATKADQPAACSSAAARRA